MFTSSSLEGRDYSCRPTSNYDKIFPNHWKYFDKTYPNHFVHTFLDRHATVSGASEQDVTFEMDSRTELDSHANMVVIGKHAYIIATSDKTVEVNPFTPDYESLKNVPIVDAAIAYDCPYTMTTYLCIVLNALLVTSMNHN